MVPGELCNLEALYLRHTGHALGPLTQCTVAAVSPAALRDLAAERRGIGEALAWLGAVENVLSERNASLPSPTGTTASRA